MTTHDDDRDDDDLTTRPKAPSVPQVWDGVRLRTLRRLRQWTQHDLARAVGCYQPQIARWEADKGKPGWDNRLKLDRLAGGIDLGKFVEETKAIPRTKNPPKAEMRTMQEEILAWAEELRAKREG